MKLDRLFAITMIIVNRKRVSAEELARYFEVSVRTIYRDIEAINGAGIPIVSYQGKNGGFEIMENYKIDRHVLTPGEIFSIINALKGVTATIDDRRINHAAEKLRTLITDSDADGLKKRQDLSIDLSPWGNRKPVKDKLDVIRNALEESRTLAFEYVDASGGVTRREAEPMTIVLKVSAWYLYAYCRMRDDFRLFRLSRMKKIKMTGRRFDRRDIEPGDLDFDRKWIETSRLVDLSLRFRPGARARAEDSFETGQIKIMKDGSTAVKIRFPDDDWVYGFILSFGEDVEVVGPPHVRRILMEKIEKINALYKT